MFPSPQIPTALELIHARLKDKSTPGHRKDPYKLAVVAEDGSMKWVVTAGMLARLEAAGIMPDLIIGTSGGGLGASYYAARAIRHGAMVIRYMNGKGFNRDGRSRKFINLWRLLKNQPVMDVESTVEIVFGQRVPFPWKNMATAVPTYLTAVTRSGDLVMQPLHGQSPAAIKLAMKNTGRIPFIGHNPRDKSVLWDGGMLASIPLQQAFDLGATHVLVVRCKGATETRLNLTGTTAMEKFILHPILRVLAPDLLRTLLLRAPTLGATLDRLATPEPHILVLALSQVNVSMMETDEGNLFRELVRAWHYTGKTLKLPAHPLPPEWQPDATHYLADAPARH